MRNIKASLKISKNGRLFCTAHKTYRVSKPPTNHCKICWNIYYNLARQTVLDEAIKGLENENP